MIRTFCFECNTCAYQFDLSVDSEEIVGYKTNCPQCKSKDCYRDYFRENVMGNAGPKTIGALADLNSAKQRKGSHEISN